MITTSLVSVDDVTDLTADSGLRRRPPQVDAGEDSRRTVELDVTTLRKLIVATVLDLGDESEIVPAVRAPGLPDDGSL